jgi:hypothetical protein
MPLLRRYFLFLGALALIAVALRVVLGWNLGLTALALFVGWPFVGTLITIDDDFPAGCGHLDGKGTPEWKTITWWVDIILCRGALVLIGMAYNERAEFRASVQLFTTAIVMSAFGFPIVIRALRSGGAASG